MIKRWKIMVSSTILFLICFSDLCEARTRTYSNSLWADGLLDDLINHPVEFILVTLGIVAFFILICCGWFCYEYSKDGGIMVGFVEVMVKLPFYSLLFALSMIFLSIWCLFCCCCPCCPQWFQNLPNTIFELIEPPPDQEAQLWKIDGTKLVNKKGITALEGECKVVPHGAMFYIENALNNKVLSTRRNSRLSESYQNKVKESIRDEKLRQLWKIGTPNEEGFFIITEISTKKVLTGDRNGLKIDNLFIVTYKSNQMWKLEGTSSDMSLVNQAGSWKSEDKWEFKENGAFISIRNISTNESTPMVLVVKSDGKIDEEEFIDNFPPQQWILGDLDQNGFFTLTHPLTSKVLTAASSYELTISDLGTETKRLEDKFENNSQADDKNDFENINEIADSHSQPQLSNTVPQNDSESIGLNKLRGYGSKTNLYYESEVQNITPRNNVSPSVGSQAWKNLKLKVKTAKAFNTELANRNIRRYGYDPDETLV